MNTVIIVAGESSGELYGALLAQELRMKEPDIRIIGMGGERMRAAGVKIISPISDAFGLVELFSSYRKIRTAFKKTEAAIRTRMPDVLVLIDYPDFNLKIAKSARALGIKILYYVSPQVWAWRKGRVKKIGRLVDRMAVLLPFEEDIYRDAGIRCEFVGHPILEEIRNVLIASAPSLREKQDNTPVHADRQALRSALGINPSGPLLSLLPGSRPSELERLLPVMIEVVRLFRLEFSTWQFCMPLAPNTDPEKYRDSLDALAQEGVVVIKGESVRALAASDLAVVASGTATLQTALLGVPMVVVYKLSPLTFFLGKLVVDVPYISLVNILAGREVVRELLQKMANPREVTGELSRLVRDKAYREEMLHHYRVIKEKFSRKHASQRVAEIVLEMSGTGNKT
jgi:lipid-A-disaccharide synthase